MGSLHTFIQYICRNSTDLHNSHIVSLLTAFKKPSIHINLVNIHNSSKLSLNTQKLIPVEILTYFFHFGE